MTFATLIAHAKTGPSNDAGLRRDPNEPVHRRTAGCGYDPDCDVSDRDVEFNGNSLPGPVIAVARNYIAVLFVVASALFPVSQFKAQGCGASPDARLSFPTLAPTTP